MQTTADRETPDRLNCAELPPHDLPHQRQRVHLVALIDILAPDAHQ